MKRFLGLLLISLMLMTTAFAKDMRFVQITDVRYSANAENEDFKKVINAVNELNDVEFVVFTGDNIQKPNQENLKSFFKEAKKLRCPFYVVIGDKDVNKRKEFGKKQFIKIAKKYAHGYSYSNPNYIFKKHGVVFFVADGAKEVVPSTNGFFKDDVLEWIDANLDVYGKKNVIIFQHFPIIPPSQKENYCTAKPERYLEILNNHKNVKAVITGHFGVNKEQKVNDVVHITTAPVPYYRVIDILDYETKNPTIWSEIQQAQ